MCIKELNKTLKMINYSKSIDGIIGFNFPSIFSCGKDYKDKVKNYLEKIYSTSKIFQNVIISNKSVNTKYEVDFLICNKKERIIVETRKNLNSSGRKISEIIVGIIERRLLMLNRIYLQNPYLLKMKLKDLKMLI